MDMVRLWRIRQSSRCHAQAHDNGHAHGHSHAHIRGNLRTQHKTTDRQKRTMEEPSFKSEFVYDGNGDFSGKWDTASACLDTIWSVDVILPSEASADNLDTDEGIRQVKELPHLFFLLFLLMPFHAKTS